MIVKDYAESKSAKIPDKRELFKQLIGDIEKGVIKGIFAWNPNRLSRNSVDTGRLIYLMDEGKLLVVKTPAQTFQNTPNDKFMLSLFCSTAKLENDNKGEDVKKGLKAKAGRGWLPNGAKPGYMNDPFAQRGSKTIKSDPIRFPIIKEAWRILLTGNYAPAHVMRILNEILVTARQRKRGSAVRRWCGARSTLCSVIRSTTVSLSSRPDPVTGASASTGTDHRR